MNGDPRKEEIATAQNYFAVSTRSHEIHQLYQEQQARIEIRLQVAEGNKNLSEAAAHGWHITMCSRATSIDMKMVLRVIFRY